MIRGHAITRQVFIANGIELFPSESQRIINHSPDGFSWGYCGSGPAQLSLAILLVFLPQACALKLYQEFKQEIISTLPSDKDFCLENEEVREWIKKKIKRRKEKHGEDI
ncbi:MAG: hypothetical protein A4E53_01686 [Pelotomaculum sp. PtaB.Bin104]|jgi:hypothetical protein|nr:MAG: hypothetical protein A4E53_01686 [Pelotomaculum sp. PtaB.Bin104]